MPTPRSTPATLGPRLPGLPGLPGLALAALLGFFVAHTGAARAEQASTGDGDNRVRIAQLLRLGRSHTPEARAELERALQDPAEAVRLAASVALVALADPAAVPAIERRLAVETSPRVRERLHGARADLRAMALKRARFVLQVGRMVNATSNTNPALSAVMATTTRARASFVAGAVLLEGPADPLYASAVDRKLPVLLLDGQLSRLARSSAPGGVSLAAHVEIVVRAVPSHALKATLRGSSTGTDTPAVLTSQARLAELESQVVGSAVESALRGAEGALAGASK
ncbi:MAG: HEAT repeat domain-containing protein [Myxococcales bacterium]|nr:HEAT repeat domain-containing protein [Myxococcales bacterium]MBL0194633.1 HEAT repeat domain-containing protein [Myxococcales bacterium]HQY65024.1 HEAT repeat domain-containing protein [Polyangiaceae bacterium]